MPPTKNGLTIRFARSVHVRGLELGHYRNLPHRWRGIAEGYTWFALVESLSGDVEMLSGGAHARCETGSVIIGEPGESYVFRSGSRMGGDIRVVRLDQSVLDSILAETDSRRRGCAFPRAPQADPRMAHALARLFGVCEAGDLLQTQERLFDFVALAARSAKDPASHGTRPTAPVRRARELLHARYSAVISLNDLARGAGMEKFALLRAFSRELGLTPHAYQVQLRMAHARRLIARGWSLAETAVAVGYSEQSSLHRRFTRLVGVTPGNYARVLE